MPVTGLRGRQVLDGDITRSDINTSTSGSALITKLIAGTNISITYTGADAGTGDVTISATGTGLNGTGFVRMAGSTVNYETSVLYSQGSITVPNYNAGAVYDAASTSGYYVVSGVGDSRGIFVINFGGSVGTIQQEYSYNVGLRYRNKTDNTTWGSWKTVWDSSNLTNLNQLTNGPGYITGNQTITLTGDVTGSGTTSIATTIGAGKVTNAMLVNSSFFIGTTSISLGRASASQSLTGVSIDGSAGSVAWTNVTGRPSALSSFTNDIVAKTTLNASGDFQFGGQDLAQNNFSLSSATTDTDQFGRYYYSGSSGSIWSRYLPVDKSGKYRMKIRWKASAGSGTYIAVILLDTSGNNINGAGTYWAYPWSGTAAPTSWTTNEYWYDGSSFPANAAYVAFGISHTNYGGGSATYYVSQLEIERYSDQISGNAIINAGGSYANPSWITSLAWSKITGAPAFLTSESDTLATVTGRGASTSTFITINNASQISNNTSVDPASYANKVVVGAVGDSGWRVTTGIGGNAGANHNWTFGHNGSNLYFGISNGSSANLNTWMQVTPGRTIIIPAYTSNGFLKTINSDGTLSVDTTTYATSTGGNASGTWAISITGSAAQLNGQSGSYYFSKDNMDAARNIVSGTNLNTDLENGGAYSSYGAGGTSWNAPFSYGGVIAYAFTSGIKAQFGFDIRHNSSDYGDLWYRTKNNLGYSTWRTMLHSGNYNSYSPTLTGGGASGTWSINITGSAGSLSSMNISQFTNNSGYITATNSDFTYAASLTLSTSWQDTGVSATNLSTSGVYIVTCALNDFAVSGGQYTETYVGIMYWYAGSTNSTNYSEIQLHHSGHADNDRYIYLRTRTDVGSSTAKIYLQIKGNGTNSGASTYTFTFKRIL